MAFCYQNCSELLWEKNGLDFCKIFEITRTSYSNCERSEQFLVTECFLNLFLEVSQSNELEKLIFKLKKILGAKVKKGVFLHPRKCHALNGKTGSTPRIPTLPNWQKPFLTHQCFHPCPSDSLISDNFEPWNKVIRILLGLIF